MKIVSLNNEKRNILAWKCGGTEGYFFKKNIKPYASLVSPKQLKNGVENGSRIHMKTSKRQGMESWVKVELRMKWGPKTKQSREVR